MEPKTMQDIDKYITESNEAWQKIYKSLPSQKGIL